MKTYLTLVGLMVSMLLVAQAETGKILFISPSNCVITIDGSQKHNVFANEPLTLELSAGDHLLQEDCSGTFSGHKKFTIEPGKQVVHELKANAAQAASGQVEKRSITVIDVNLTIPSELTLWDPESPSAQSYDETGRPVFVYYFGAGDVIRMNLSLENKKGTQWIRVKSFPDDNLIYSEDGFTNLEDKTLKIETAGIYVITLGTKHMFDRSAKFSLMREVTGGEEVKDSRVKVVTSYRLETVVKQQEFWVNSTSNQDWKDGKAVITVPVHLPKNTERWYYSVSAFDDEETTKQTMKQMDGFSSLGKAVATATGADILSQIFQTFTAPPGTLTCDVSLFDGHNHKLLLEGGSVPYSIKEGNRDNIKQGEIEIKTAIFSPAYVVISNSEKVHGVGVVFEAAAVVRDEMLVSVSDIPN